MISEILAAITPKKQLSIVLRFRVVVEARSLPTGGGGKQGKFKAKSVPP